MRRKENLLSIAGRVTAMALSGHRRFAALLTSLGTKLFFSTERSFAAGDVMGLPKPSQQGAVCLQAGLSQELTCVHFIRFPPGSHCVSWFHPSMNINDCVLWGPGMNPSEKMLTYLSTCIFHAVSHKPGCDV